MSTGPPRLVLASASPRRRELLAGLGLELAVRPAAIDETPRLAEPPRDHVLRLAEEKAAAVAATAAADEVVLAADTIVVLDDEILGKPADDADAALMLRRLADRRHQVLTAVAVVTGGGEHRLAAVEATTVRFAALSDAEIDWYVATGEPRDKAGAYGIQGLGSLFVDSIEGNYANVVGLPIPLVYRLLRGVGIDLMRR